MKAQCEGYCGGMVKISEARYTTPDGERFCIDCYDQLQRMQ
jgi:hypothetical protein